MYYVMYNEVKLVIYQTPSTVIDIVAVSCSELTERIEFQAPHWLRGIISLINICQFFK